MTWEWEEIEAESRKEKEMDEQKPNVEMWATVELMGHAQTAGRISRPSDWGGLLRVDVPVGDTYRTEFYGTAAIYAIKIVAEEIARAMAQPVHSVIAFDTPIITRDQHQAVTSRLESQARQLQYKVDELTRRLTMVQALPEPMDEDRESLGD